MPRLLLVITFFLCCTINSFAQLSVITSWIRNTTGATGYNSLPCNVQSVYYTATDVYVSASSIPAYSIGPWVANPNTPSNQNAICKFTRNPTVNNGTKTNTALGNIGLWTNGVGIFNAKDGFYWNPATSGWSNGVTTTGWNRNAYYWEGISFDACKGHPTNTGLYHHHISPSCLYNQTASSAHSPIIGYAFDGFPIYGAYAYTNTNGTGAIKRMVSSYVLSSIANRNSGTNGTSQAGPPVNSSYPLGSMCEDYVYTAGSGDLDEYNGRFCVTPEYPSGIYAYFVTIDGSGNPAYPFVLANKYYGVVGSTSSNNTIPGTATQYTGQALPVDIYGFTVQVQNNSTAMVRWMAVNETDVMQYDIERSTNGREYTRIGTVNATGNYIYTYADADLRPGTYYYRLKMVDKNGSSRYTNIVTAGISVKGNFLMVHNNPAKDMLTIQSNDALKERSVELVNMSGQVVLRGTMQQGITMQSFNIQTLYSGVYVLRITNGTETQTVQVLISN